MNEWSPDSWQRKRALQQPAYPDPAQLRTVLEQLSTLPPLVTSWEVESLRSELAQVAAGESFFLQGGDCSENFDECRPEVLASKLKILLQMSLILVHGCKRRVTRVGRFAGQYAKPRSSDTETRKGQTLPSYRGDLINRTEFTPEAREPDPWRLLRGYERAALTLNFVRALVAGGFADLHHPEYWDLGFFSESPQAQDYQNTVDAINDSIQFMETIAGATISALNRVDFYTSHEGLHLDYEQALTRRVPRRVGWYNLGTHFPWIGDRTRQLDGAHLEFFRGILNPVGVKVGPSMSPGELLSLVDALNPNNEPGKLTLIHRFGAERIEDCLPPLLKAVRQGGKSVVWCCDPMHGNTESTRSGLKTRAFDNIRRELDLSFSIHREVGTWLGGVHFELTGEDVTECIGGARGLDEAGLQRAYRSQVDPRLNYEQALELALLIASRMRT